MESDKQSDLYCDLGEAVGKALYSGLEAVSGAAPSAPPATVKAKGLV